MNARSRSVCRLLVASLLSVSAAAASDYSCPMDGTPTIRQKDAEAREGGRFNSARPGGKHGALDLNGAVGDTVYAVRDGSVGIAQLDWGAMGNTVIIDHGDGEYTVYGHLESIVVKEGSPVTAGVKIGTVGYSGNASPLKTKGLPPHLHFAFIRAGTKGLAAKGKPLRKMKDWGDHWKDVLGAEAMGPVNPQLVMGSQCWSGSSTIGAPGEK